MAFLIDKDTRVIVQGITGNQGRFHTGQMLEFGTNIVAGVSPNKGGGEVEGVPVYDTVEAAVLKEEANASIIFIPAPLAKNGILEAVNAGIKQMVVITEGIPLHDALEAISYARLKGAVVVGPNTFGVISPGESKLGIMPHRYYVKGPVGIAARSGTLSYEIVSNLKDTGMGISTAVGLGGDRVAGIDFVDVIKRMEGDFETELIVLIGEIGGGAEEEAAEYIKRHVTKPVLAYLAGRSAPPGKRMGHAGAIIERGKGSWNGKVKALKDAGVEVAELPFQVPELARKLLR